MTDSFRTDSLRTDSLRIDSLPIDSKLLWGLMGLALALASKGCFVDPVLPSPCMGLLVAYLCSRSLGQGQADQQAAGSLFGWRVSVKGAFVIMALSSFLPWWPLSKGKDCAGNLSFNLAKQPVPGPDSVPGPGPGPGNRRPGHQRLPADS